MNGKDLDDDCASCGEANRAEFARYLKLARRNRWRVPDPEQDSHGPRAWLSYWQAEEQRERTRARWRPVPPHMPGQRGPEDIFQRAERINRNREMWRGYLT